MLHSTNPTGPNQHLPQPILELTSQHPGSGTTALLTQLIALALLPTHYGGKSACVALLDTDSTFSASRLAQQLRQHLPPSEPASTIETALTHLHVFRPQSLPSLISTLASLPTYLLTKPHPSTHRALAFIALDSATSFHWQARAADEDRLFAEQHPQTQAAPPTAPPTAQPTLATALKTATAALAAPLVYTAHSPLATGIRPTLRLALKRNPVRPFPPTYSVTEALREAGDRQRAVEGAGWEARAVEQREVRGRGFGFMISEGGVKLTIDGEG